MTNPPCWEPPKPIGSRWQRMGESVRLVVSVAGLVGGHRTVAAIAADPATGRVTDNDTGSVPDSDTGTGSAAGAGNRLLPAPRARSAAGNAVRA